MENKLREFREKKKLTQVQFCKMCGIKTHQEYGAIELGKRQPKVGRAIKIARALNKKVEAIWVNY